MNEQLDQPQETVPEPPAVSPSPAKPTRAARTARVPRPPRPPTAPPKDDESDGFWARHRVKAIVLAVLLVGGAVVFFLPSSPSKPERKAPDRIVSITIPPPLPPPPPPPPPPKIQPPPPKEEMLKETAPEEAPKPKEAAPPKAADAPAPLGTNLKGPGSDSFGLSGSGNGGGLGLGGGNAGRPSSRFGWYAGQVQSKIAEALRQNRKTRNAALRVEVRVWPDMTGRITRAQLSGSTGDAALDQALQNEVLNGLRLQEPPPEGMPLPIVLRLSARRPN